MATKEITNKTLELQQNLQQQFSGLGEEGKAAVTSSLNDLNTASAEKGLSPIQIPAESLGKNNSVSMPTDDGTASAAQAAQDNAAITTFKTGMQEAADTPELDAVENRILELQGIKSGEGAFQAEQAAQENVGGLRTNLADLNAEFEILQAQSNALPDQIEARFGGAGTRRVSGNIQKGKANEIRANALLKAAEISATTGKLNNAINLVNSAVTAKYAPIYAEIALREAQLKIVEKRVGREDKKRVEANKLQLEQNRMDIEKREKNENAMKELTLEAMSKGEVPTGVMEQLNSIFEDTEDSDLAFFEAASVLSPYMKDAPKTTVIDLNGSKKLINSETGDVIASFGAGGIGTGSGTGGLLGLTPAARAVYDQPFVYHTLTPTDQKDILGELQPLGFSVPRKLNSEQQKAANIANSGLASMAEFESLMSKGGEGMTVGEIGSSLQESGHLGKFFATFTEVGALRSNIVDTISRIRTGAAMTPSEENFYNGLVPRFGDSKEAAAQKLDQLKVFFTGISGTPVVLEAPDGSVYKYTDLFDPIERQEVRQAITDGDYKFIDY